MCGIGLLITRRSKKTTQTPQQKAEGGFQIDSLLEKIKARGPDYAGVVDFRIGDEFELHLAASVLQLRGDEKTPQPLIDKATGNILCWNGEIFGGALNISPSDNDTRVLLTALSKCAETEDSFAAGNTVADVLNSIEGPYAFVYYQAKTRTLWFGRDVWGRRSLLQTIAGDNSLFALCSVAVRSHSDSHAKSESPNERAEEEQERNSSLSMWSELPINAIYSLQIPNQEKASECEGFSFSSSIRTHKRTHGVYLSEEMFFPLGHRAALPETQTHSPPASQTQFEEHSKRFLEVLSDAVRVRVTSLPFHRRVGVLFSGGLDSSVLALLAHRHIDPSVPIDLLNVAFSAPPNESNESGTDKPEKKQKHKKKTDISKSAHSELQSARSAAFASSSSSSSSFTALITREGNDDDGGKKTVQLDREKHKEIDGKLSSACSSGGTDPFLSVPDRQTGLIALMELRRLAPNRTWNFVEVNVMAAEVEEHKKEICDLIFPGNTMLDITIGAAFWFAARGKGQLRVFEHSCAPITSGEGFLEKSKVVPYTTDVRVLLMGNGADEQLAGYGRHRTAFLKWGGWNRLQSELDLDTARLWRRNLGRDDRVVSAHAREVRQPYLDENVVRFINATPLSLICNMLEKPGHGDKKLLREVGKLLGFEVPAHFVKKAIQFGSRVKTILSPKSSDVFDE